jgi:hypothetical protein
VLEHVLDAGPTIRPGKVEIAACSPLSIRVLRLSLPARASTVELEITGSGHPRVQLLLGEGRTVAARSTGRTTRLRVALRGGEQYGARLVVTGSALEGWGRGVSVRLRAS